MKISELMAQLNQLAEAHGDLWVYVGTRYAISFAETVSLLQHRTDGGSLLIEGDDDEDLHELLEVPR